MDWPKVSWRCEPGKPCAIGGAPEVTNLVVGVVDEETSPGRPLDPATVDVVVLPAGGGTLPPVLRAKKKDPKGGVVFRYEGVVEGWYRVRAFRRAGPGGPIYREVTRPVQVVKIRRPVKPEDEHKAVTLMLGRPAPAEKPRGLTFFQLGFFDRNAPTEPIPGLWVVLRVPGSPELRMLRADLNGQVLLVEPDISPGLVDVISIVDDGGGPQSDSLVVYDEFAPRKQALRAARRDSLRYGALRTMIMRALLLVCLMTSAGLWILKLHTAHFADGRSGTTGIIWRARPSLNNYDIVHEDSAVSTDDRVFLIKADEWGYPGESVYLWSVDHGYACSTVVTVLLVPLAFRRRRRVPASASE